MVLLDWIATLVHAGLEYVASGDDPAVLECVRPRGPPPRLTHRPDEKGIKLSNLFPYDPCHVDVNRAYNPVVFQVSDVAS